MAAHPEIPAGASAVVSQAITEVTTAVSQITEPHRGVLRSQQAWADFWDDFYGTLEPKPSVPDLDFTGHVVAVAALGTRNSGGFAVQIEGAFEAEGVLWVAVAETRPGPLCMTTAALTAPATAARIESTAQEVRFTERVVETDCS